MTNWDRYANPRLAKKSEREGVALLSKAQREAHVAVARIEKTIETLEKASRIYGFGMDAERAKNRLETARRTLIDGMQSIGFW